MTEKRKRLNFKQTAKGQIYFDGTVEYLQAVDEHEDKTDIAKITKSSNAALVAESLELFKEAIEQFSKDGFDVINSKVEV